MNIYIRFPKGDCKYVFPSNKTQWCQLFDYKEMFSNAELLMKIQNPLYQYFEPFQMLSCTILFAFID